jgi:hypothetical protein
LAELIAKCSQGEERLRAEHKDFVNLIRQDFNRNHDHDKSGGKSCRQKKGKGNPRKMVLNKSPQTRVLSDTIALIGGT